jgi:DNA-directed RNA polymerase specialized sigma24 family protein
MIAAVGDHVADGASADRLGVLYEEHAPDALRLAWLLTGDRAVAQDLVQDAFVKMAGRLHHLRRQEAFGAYLRVTVVNLARMRGRRLKVERDYLARHQADLREQHRDPDVADAESLRRFYEDLPDEATAQVLGCRQATVRSLIHRGLGTLRSELGEWVE